MGAIIRNGADDSQRRGLVSIDASSFAGQSSIALLSRVLGKRWLYPRGGSVARYLQDWLVK